jgi:transcriptional regulator with XRE-family HTH domain
MEGHVKYNASRQYHDGPTVVRRHLARLLRQARKQTGRTIEDVVMSGIASRPTLSRFESGRVPVNPGKVLELCRLYELDGAETDALYELALGSQQRGWWEDRRETVGTELAFYIGLEAATSVIQSYEPEVLLGLLQTEAYARAVECCDAPVPDEEIIDRRVAIRLKRQQTIFERTPPIRIRAVLGAGVLAREVGGPEVLAAQVDHLRKLAKDKRMDLRVLPWQAGAHAAIAGPFTLMRYEDPDDPSVVYVETAVGGSYFELSAQVDRYSRVFRDVYRRSIPLEEYRP